MDQGIAEFWSGFIFQSILDLHKAFLSFLYEQGTGPEKIDYSPSLFLLVHR
jgi:hypothetical protein